MTRATSVRERRPPLALNAGRRKDIQGMRGVAVLLVVAYHGGLALPGGFTGVDVFFVISGFVITRMLLREVASTGRLSFVAFYSRRVRRILPAIALMTVVVAACSLFFVSSLEPKQVTAKTGVAASLFVANLFVYRNPQGYFGAGPELNPLLHTWSLSVEEQFYLLFPAVFLAAWWLAHRMVERRGRLATVAVILACLAVASFVLSYHASQGAGGPAVLGFGPQFAFYMAPARAWEFIAGALLALAGPKLARITRRTAVASGIVGALLIGVGALTINSETPFPGTAALIPVSGTCLLLVAGSATRTGVSRLLGFGPITRIGDLSYSWYLWHWPLIVFARSLWPGAGYVVPVAALTSLFPAWLAYRYLENPVRLDSRLVGRRAFSLALICIVVPVLASLALSRARLPGQSPETAARLVALSQRHVDEIRHCESGELTERCTWPVARDRGTVMLVGDSNAAQFIEPASRAANAKGYSFSVLTRHACRFVDVIVVRAGRRDPACRSYVVETLRTLEQQSPVLVFIASSSPGIVNSPNVALEDPVTGRVARTLRAKSRAWSEGVTRVHRQLSDAHIPTVLIQTIPQFPNWHPNCAAIRAYLDPQSCGASLLRAEVDEYRSAALDAEDRGLRSVPGSVSLDFADLLCGRTKCSTNQGNFWYYRDNYHLSVRGSLRLTPAFVECIVTHARDERPSALHSTEPVPTCQDRVRRPV